jgi:hypothetical protein
MQIIRAVIWSILFGALTAPVSHAQTSKDAAYLCTTEMAVGFEYNKSIKKWHAVTVVSDSLFSKLTLRLKHLRDRVGRNSAGENEDITDYLVTITGKGTNAAVPCTFGGTGIASKIIIVGDNNNVVCKAKSPSGKFRFMTKGLLQDVAA